MVIFFVSPVTWQPSMIGNNSLIIKLNPIVYFLDIDTVSLVRSCAYGNILDRVWDVSYYFVLSSHLHYSCDAAGVSHFGYRYLVSTIELENIYLRYPIYGAGSRSLKRDIVNFFSRGKYDYQNRITYIDALNGLSFSLQSGDYLGLIGHNGAGKSTLLRVLSGIYEPTQGQLRVNGAVSALLGSSVGMQPEMSGYENIQNQFDL